MNGSDRKTDLTRRNMLAALGAAGAVAMASPSAAAPARQAGPAVRKIDVHHHVVAPVWAEAMRAIGFPHAVRPWSPEASLAFMDAHRIEAAILSLTSPGVTPFEGARRRELARRINDYTAGLVQKWPRRFGHFATLPLPDMDGALAELDHALGRLSADGVILLSNIGDTWLGDPSLAPLWRELDRRKAVVFVHPNALTLPGMGRVPSAMVDFPFATTRTAVDMVLGGVMTPQSGMKVILAHGGGFLPYVSQRLIETGSTVPGAPDKEVLRQSFRQFYFDTALSSGPPALTGMKLFADPGHILFGSDFPYAAGLSGPFTDAFDGSPHLTDAERRAIARGNAGALFGRLRL